MSSVAPPAPLVTDAGTPVGAPASAWQPVGPRMVLGESPMWHPDEQVLWVCDIPGHRLHRLDPATGVHRDWAFDTDVACCAPMPGGELLLGMRDGTAMYFELALLVALLGFVSTVALAKFLMRGEVIE